jgi:hypothetical protein
MAAGEDRWARAWPAGVGRRPVKDRWAPAWPPGLERRPVKDRWAPAWPPGLERRPMKTELDPLERSGPRVCADGSDYQTVLHTPTAWTVPTPRGGRNRRTRWRTILPSGRTVTPGQDAGSTGAFQPPLPTPPPFLAVARPGGPTEFAQPSRRAERAGGGATGVRPRIRASEPACLKESVVAQPGGPTEPVACRRSPRVARPGAPHGVRARTRSRGRIGLGRLTLPAR